MRRLLGPALLLLLPATALGQAFRPGTPYLPPLPPPRVTPYLGLVTGGNPAANYYINVQPQVRRGLDTRLYAPSALLPGSFVPPASRVPDDLGELSLIPIQPQSGHGAGFGLTAPYFQLPNRQTPFIPFGGREPDPLPRPAKK